MKFNILSFFFILSLFSSFLIYLSCYSDQNTGSKTSCSSDSSAYSDVSWGIMAGITDIYNTNVANQSSSVNKTVSCPFGGSVTITGTASSSGGTTTVNLTYAMDDCGVVNSSSDKVLKTSLAINGTITEKGSWNNSTDYTSLNYQSESLSYTGSITRSGCSAKNVRQTCAFSAMRTTSGTNAVICGNTVSW